MNALETLKQLIYVRFEFCDVDYYAQIVSVSERLSEIDLSDLTWDRIKTIKRQIEEEAKKDNIIIDGDIEDCLENYLIQLDNIKKTYKENKQWN